MAEKGDEGNRSEGWNCSFQKICQEGQPSGDIWPKMEAGKKDPCGSPGGKGKPGRGAATAKALRPVLPLRIGGGAGELNHPNRVSTGLGERRAQSSKEPDLMGCGSACWGRTVALVLGAEGSHQRGCEHLDLTQEPSIWTQCGEQTLGGQEEGQRENQGHQL